MAHSMDRTKIGLESVLSDYYRLGSALEKKKIELEGMSFDGWGPESLLRRKEIKLEIVLSNVRAQRHTQDDRVRKRTIWKTRAWRCTQKEKDRA